MTPGPVKIIGCPKCSALAQYSTLRSGNTFGARVWTDGKQLAPMLPRPPAVVRCGSCGQCYWLARAREVGEIDWSGGDETLDPAWRSAPAIKEPTEEEYYGALEKGLAANAREEQNLRVLAWWRRNDAFRNVPPPATAVISGEAAPWQQNLKALVRILDVVGENAIMKAEAHRELGEFDVARQILSESKDKKLASVVRQLELLCEQGDIWPRELHFDR